MKKLLLILLCVPLIGFGQSKNVVQISTYENGNIKEDKFYKDTSGWIYRYYSEDGQLRKVKGKYIYQRYHKNGKLFEEGNYHHLTGYESGLWKRYFQSGQLSKLVNYRLDGKIGRVGKYEEYYENGQLREKGNYKDGNEDGLWIKFYKNGNIKEEKVYKDERSIDHSLLISKKCWDKKGNEIECEWKEWELKRTMRKKILN